jgi:hypothetical protein
MERKRKICKDYDDDKGKEEEYGGIYREEHTQVAR